LQLNFWLLIMIVGAATILGVNASFLTEQQQLQVGIPWLVLLLILFPNSFRLSFLGSGIMLMMRLQVFSLLDMRLGAYAAIHRRDVMVNPTTATPAWDRDNGVVYTVHTVDRGVDCLFSAALGAKWECEWELSVVCEGEPNTWSLD
jgi:hypothetical protein